MAFETKFDSGRRCALETSTALALALPFALLATPNIARAQSASPVAESQVGGNVIPSSPQTASRDEEAIGIGDIIVTARKRAETARDVPTAIQAIGGDQLVKLNVTNMVALTAIAPNLTISSGTTQPLTIIRGLGSGSNLSFDQAVGKFVDNVSYGRDQDMRLPLFDLERVEVLKGPQVVTFGNSTTAGALNMTTVKPGDQFALDLSGAYEFKSQETNLQGGATLPLASWASLRVAGLFQNLNRGWVRNLSTNNTGPNLANRAGRASLLLKPTNDLEVLTKVEIDRVREGEPAMQPFIQSKNPPNIFTDVTDPTIRYVSNAGAPLLRDEFTRVNNDTYQTDINYQLGNGTLTSTSAWRSMRAITSFAGALTPVPVASLDINQRYTQFSQELRYTGKTDIFDYTVGGYYQRDTLRVFADQAFNLQAIGRPRAPFARVIFFNTRNRTLSGFLDVTAHLASQLSLEGGLRYTSTRRLAEQSTSGASIVPGSFLNISEADLRTSASTAFNALVGTLGVTPHSFTGLATNEDHWQPQLILQYKPNPLTNVYFKFVKGAKSGGVDYVAPGGNPDAARFKPEKATSYELGIKGTLANRFDYAFDVYSTTFQDLQVSSFTGNATFIVTNAGKARSRGAELELGWRPTRGLRLSFNGAYLDAGYLEFKGAACTYAQTIATPVGTTCTQDLSGTPTQYASKWSGSLSASYQHSVGSDLFLTETVAIRGRSKYNAGTSNNVLDVQEGYAQLDASLELAPAGGPWTLAVFGRNLTNKQYSDFTNGSALNTGGEIYSLSRPRQIGLRFGLKL